MQTKICKECKQERSIKKFHYQKDGTRKSKCHFCTYDGLSGEDKAEILEEAYRHYEEFEQYVTDTGKDVISYTVPKSKGSEEYITIYLAFSDLKTALDNVKLSRRKKEAFELYVQKDMLQREAAAIMEITTVSVGQYVNQAMEQLATWYFSGEHQDTLQRISEEDT